VELEKGHLKATTFSKCSDDAFISQIHGFFHVADLDFFKSPTTTQFRRRYDDQLAVTVTVPAAI
jgi:hypothetical protein